MAKQEKTKVRRVKDHDIFMRGIFSYVQFVLKILHYVIPTDLKPFIDFSTLKTLTDTHISDKLLLTQSDTIYEAALNTALLPEVDSKNKDVPVFRFCFLSEFKSSKPSEPIDFQLDDYVKSIQRNDIKNGRPASIVLPILIYHGETAWENKRIYDTAERYLHPTILKYVNSSVYFTIDLQAMSDDLIRNTTDLGELRAAFLSLKHAQDKQFFVDNFDELLIFAENTPTTLLLEAYVKMLLEYIQRRSGLTDKKINDFIEQSKSKFSMAATAKQTMFDRHEAKVLKKATANALEKARKEVNEAYAQEIQEANTKLQEAKSQAQEAKSQAQEAKSQAQEAKSQAQEANRANVIRLIKNIQLTDNQIVESLDLPLDFVQAIRNEITV